jgi:hypothetical protein
MVERLRRVQELVELEVRIQSVVHGLSPYDGFEFLLYRLIRGSSLQSHDGLVSIRTRSTNGRAASGHGGGGVESPSDGPKRLQR